MRLNKRYLALTIILFITEVLIGVYVRDNFIRPFGGDFLVVILIYCFVKSFFNWPVIKTAIGVLVFSYMVEMLQYFKIVNLLGLKQNLVARIIIGTSFSWVDMACYTAGIALVLVAEYTSKKYKKPNGVTFNKKLSN